MASVISETKRTINGNRIEPHRHVSIQGQTVKLCRHRIQIQNLSKLAGESADGHIQPPSRPNKQGTKCLLLKQVKFIS